VGVWEGERGEGEPKDANQRRRLWLFTSVVAVYSCGSVGGKKKGSGTRDLQDVDAHDEGEQWELREVSTSDEMFQAPAMARWRRVREGGGVRGLHGCAKGRGRGSNSVFKDKEEGRGSNGRGIGHQWPKGRRRLIAFKRERGIDGGGVTEGEVKEERGGRGL
jgi:hypothetical protein